VFYNFRIPAASIDKTSPAAW